MPESPAGPCVERHERVAEQIVALAVAAVEIEPRAAEVDERDAALFVDGGLAPVVDTALLLVRLRGPRVVADLAGVRDRVEYPHRLAGHDVIRLNVRRVGLVLRA